MKETIQTLKQAVDEVETVVWATCEFGSLGREKMNVLVNKLVAFKIELQNHCEECGLCLDPIDKVNCSENSLIKKILGEEKHD